MKHFLKVTSYSWKPGSQTEMLYENDKEEFFIGPPSNIVIGNTYTVEVADKLLEDKYYQII
jgi:hypothetical protein